MSDFNKILIANRGEIALRVMRTCKDLNIKTVGIYSEQDKNALHTQYADEVYFVDSYLDIKNIIAICKESNSQAVHPGYGFLSENPEFADSLEKNNLILIGPKSESMRMMASKTQARKVMQDADVPVIPGANYSKNHGIEYPVMLKAAYGGGGKGMRLVHKAEDLKSNYELAKSEALKSFGNDEVYIEKFLEEPRHIEIQILADQNQNIIAFPERECSVQRRHQKVIEESPSVFVDLKMREAMCQIAAEAAKAVKYIGAGTVEFLVDKHKNFYFMEMNTRLQVEHPITEEITQIDLVKHQIEIAQGKLFEKPFEIKKHNGWAIEARICAEDCANSFMPAPGKVELYRPALGPNIRVDSGLESGQDISLDYDPMLEKIIAWAPSRQEAINKLKRALCETKIIGSLKTNLDFCKLILENKNFLSGEYDTSILNNLCHPALDAGSRAENLSLIAAAILAFENRKDQSKNNNKRNINSKNLSGWQRALD